MSCPASCLNCSRVRRCTHVREVALSIFLQVKVLSTAARLFEISAEACPDYSEKRKSARRKNDGQHEFLFT